MFLFPKNAAIRYVVTGIRKKGSKKVITCNVFLFG